MFSSQIRNGNYVGVITYMAIFFFLYVGVSSHHAIHIKLTHVICQLYLNKDGKYF